MTLRELGQAAYNASVAWRQCQRAGGDCRQLERYAREMQEAYELARSTGTFREVPLPLPSGRVPVPSEPPPPTVNVPEPEPMILHAALEPEPEPSESTGWLPESGVEDEGEEIEVLDVTEQEIVKGNAALATYRDQVIAGLRARGFSVDAVLATPEAKTGPYTMQHIYVLHLTKEGFTSRANCGWREMQMRGVDGLVTHAANAWNFQRNMALTPETAEQIGVPVYTPPAAAPSPPAGPGQVTQTVPDVPVTTTPGPVPGREIEETIMPPTVTLAERTLAEQIEDLAVGQAGRETMNWDEWNWFYTQVTGHPGPSPESFGIERRDPMPDIRFSEWADKVLVGDQLAEPITPGVAPVTPVKVPAGLRGLLEQLLALIKVLLYGRSS